MSNSPMLSGTPRKGQALVLAIFFMLLIFSYATIMFRASMQTLNVVNAHHERAQALWLAEAGIERALWCLSQSDAESENCNGGVGVDYTGETLSLDVGAVTTAVTTVTEDMKRIHSTGTTERGTEKRIVVDADGENGEALIFALLGGSGSAIRLENGATIEGEIHLNGDLECASNNAIKGSVSLSGQSRIDNCNVTGDVTANTIDSTTVSGDARYAVIVDSSVGGQLFSGSADPDEYVLPYTEEQFVIWRQEAAAGGTTTGDVDLNGQGNRLGPRKIDGNLTLRNGSETFIDGTVYVTGDLTINNNSDIILNPAYGAASGIVLVEGKVDVSNGLTITSSEESSYLFFIGLDDSLSTSDPAFTVNNNAEAAIFYAANGLIDIGNNLFLNGVVGASMRLGQNSTVIYEKELENVNFNTETGNPVLVYRRVSGTRVER